MATRHLSTAHNQVQLSCLLPVPYPLQHLLLWLPGMDRDAILNRCQLHDQVAKLPSMVTMHKREGAEVLIRAPLRFAEAIPDGYQVGNVS